MPIVFGDPLPTKVANKTDEEIEEVLKNSDHVVEGAVSLSSQNHFYLENQSAEAWFDEERVCLQVATQVFIILFYFIFLPIYVTPSLVLFSFTENKKKNRELLICKNIFK